MKIIECVPNISEGRNKALIDEIASVVTTVEGVALLDVDPGKATNRTVITFAGDPDSVIEAAFRLIKRASERIDMSKHKGEHPRMGATDVCPLVPVSGISMEEVVEYAHKLGERVGRELQIPGYFYESAAKEPKRKNLANCRSGEYEGLSKKFVDPEWQPDFGSTDPSVFVRTGATAISARNFLVAYNVNLNTTSTRRANSIAFDIRETGRVKREGDPLTGKVVTDSEGKPVFIPGRCKAVKGIGWFIEEYGIAQISYNLTDIGITSMHKAFEETCQSATEKGLRVTGSELIGLVPLNAMLEAGKYFLKKQQRSTGIPDKDIIHIAIKSLGLDELKPFIPEERIIEYKLESAFSKPLLAMNLSAFANETASESPAPGGGSISAYVGALGVSLGTMVANLSAHKRGWDDKWAMFSDWAEKGMVFQKQLLNAVDEDTAAFNKIMDAFALPKSSEDEILIRKKVIHEATINAIEVPFKVMQLAYESMDVMKAMTDIGNPNSVTDAAVGALCARTAVHGAYLNVRINCKDFSDSDYVEKMLKNSTALLGKAVELEKTILEMAELKM
jgi:glutamate formiminotransferase / formiminotetrahydrofolate cyclodeaminase